MKASEISTVTMPLFLSFRLILATTHPSRHESVSTKTESSRISTTQPTRAAAEKGTVTR